MKQYFGIHPANDSIVHCLRCDNAVNVDEYPSSIFSDEEHECYCLDCIECKHEEDGTTYWINP
jgi:hypothetical protein